MGVAGVGADSCEIAREVWKCAQKPGPQTGPMSDGVSEVPAGGEGSTNGGGDSSTGNGEGEDEVIKLFYLGYVMS